MSSLTNTARLPNSGPINRLLRSQRFLTNTDIPISVAIHLQNDLKLHRHEFTELVIVLDGTGDHLFDEKRFPICAGDAFVVDQNHSHGYCDTKSLRIANVLFDEPYVNEREPSLSAMPGYHAFIHLEPAARTRLEFEAKLRLGSETMSDVKTLLRRLTDELKRRREGYIAMASTMLIELLVILCRTYTTSDTEPHRDLMDIGRVIGYIENRYNEEIELKDLTGIIALSSRSLLRKFGRATGTTPTQYLIRVRVSHGASMLRTTSLSVTEIANLVGFEDGNYFSRQFRNVIGMSPTQYRRAASA